MQSTAGHKLLQRNRLYRGMAIFLLVFALVDLTIIDLAFPQFCESDLSPRSASLNAKLISLDLRENNERDRGSDQSCEEEDCFCCCSHIVPGVPVNVAALGLKTLVPAAIINSLPSPPPQSTYHPPRVS
jgi:hypothetical protein